MKYLFIYSNHHSGNFNHHLLDALIETLSKGGHEIVVRDLYQLNFNPVLRKEDFEAISAGNTPDDIANEQKFITWADILVFVYPVWWGSMPAIMKGYIDRVFSWGFAYKSNGKGVYPLLTGKKAVVMSTLGQTRLDYEKGMHQSMAVINEQGVFGFCGIEVAEQINFYSIHNISEEEKTAAINNAGDVLLALEQSVGVKS